mgnify:FL=1
MAQNVTTLDLSTALVVFISHLWHRDPDELHPRPDNRSNDAFSLCQKGLRQLHDQHAALLHHCYVWLDYSCVSHTEWVDSARHRKRLNKQAAAAKKAQQAQSQAQPPSRQVYTQEHRDKDLMSKHTAVFSGGGGGIDKATHAAPCLTYQHLELDTILSLCDCMFTPVVSSATWGALALSLGYVLPDPVEGWNKTSACYMNR